MDEKQRPRQKRNRDPAAAHRYGISGTAVRRGNNGGILAGVILVFMLIYIGGFVYTYLNRERVMEGQIVLSSIEDSSLTRGIIIRDEKVYKSPGAGAVTFIAGSGEKVKKGALIASVSDIEITRQLQKELNAIDTSILKMKEDRDYLFKDDVINANKLMGKLCDESGFDFAVFSPDKLYTAKDKLTAQMNFRNDILLHSDIGGSGTLAQERNIYASQLSALQTPVLSEESGIVNYIVDGYEDTATLDILYSVPAEYINAETEERLLVTVKEASAGQDIFKLILSNEWYIAAYMNPSVTNGWSEGDVKTIYIDEENGRQSLEVRVKAIVPGDQSTYVVFSTSRYVSEFANRRILTFGLSRGTKKGMQIPNTAIVEKTYIIIPKEYFTEEPDKKWKLLKKTAMGIEEIIISATDYDDANKCISADLSKLKLSDILVSAELTMPEYVVTRIENVTGIYITNSGTAVFRRINTKGAQTSSPGFTILDMENNTSLKVHDRIVMDTKNVSEGQLVY